MSLPLLASFAIATACGSFDIFTLFCHFAKVKKFYDTLARPLYDELERRANLKTIDGRAEWVRAVYRFCHNAYALLVPFHRPKKSSREKKTTGWSAQRYVPLLAYGFVPTCTWAGVIYSFSSHLDPSTAFLVLITVNAVKTAVLGYFAVRIPFWSVLPTFVVGPAIIQYVADRFIKKHSD